MSIYKVGPLQCPFDVKKYMGSWYQIAAIPMPFNTEGNRSTATYTLLENGTVHVYNVSYNVSKGEWSVVADINGTATIPDEKKPAALEVSFPGFSPPTGPNYLVHDTDYKYSVVGSPDRKNLFILYREKKMNEKLYCELKHYAKKLGYDVDALVIDYHAIKD